MSKAANLLEVVKAMDTSSGVHPPEGYPRTFLPDKISNIVHSRNTGKITKAIKYDTGWMVQVDKLDAKGKDFTDLVDAGLTGVRVDDKDTILLYFK